MICQRIKLLKDMPNCPKGRQFLQDIAGDWFHRITAYEVIKGKFQDYKLSKQTVLDNPDWFKKMRPLKI